MKTQVSPASPSAIAAHTPGPGSITFYHAQRPSNFHKSVKYGAFIGPMGDRESTKVTVEGAILDPVKAVCALMAAAPELLTALEGMFEAHDSYSGEFNPSGRARKVANWALINDNMVKARAAIAKARQ